MAFDGSLLSTPPSGGAPPLADALLVEYAGVVASQPSAPAVSPNGDGVAETAVADYKVVRPSTVTVQLRGPDGALRVNTQHAAARRHVPVPVECPPRGRDAGAGRPWRFTVGATDDLGRTSSVERDFTLDLTLGIADDGHARADRAAPASRAGRELQP